MRRRRLSKVVGGFLLLACALGWSSEAEETSDPAPENPGFRTSAPELPDSEPMRALPRDAYREDPVIGIPEQSLFRNSRALPLPNSRAFLPTPSVQGGTMSEQVRLEAPNFNANFPLLQKGFAPQDADLKIGPLYFKLNAISGAMLASDNIDLTENDRKSGVIAIVRLTGTMVAQLTEGLHLAVSGSFVYLPLQGDFGFGGTASRIPYSLGLAAIPALRSQLSWEVMIAGWPVLLSDEFRTGIGTYSFSTRDDFSLFEGEEFNGEDREGRHAFRLPAQPTNSKGQQNRDLQSTFVYFNNEVSASIERLLPGEIRLHVRGFQENLWYNQGNRGLPTLRDGVSVLLRDENPNLRFQPFLTYNLLYTSVTKAFEHQIRVGLEGPVTEQMEFRGYAGAVYFTRDNSTNLLFALGLHHQASPYTRESLSFDRAISDFGDELNTTATFNFHQILGPKLSSSLFASYGRVEDLLRDYSARDELRTGIRFELEAGPRTHLELSGIYTKITHDPSGQGDTGTWTARLDLTHRFTDTFLVRLLYQYQLRDSSEADRSYAENLMFLSLTKYFR